MILSFSGLDYMLDMRRLRVQVPSIYIIYRNLSCHITLACLRLIEMLTFCGKRER